MCAAVGQLWVVSQLSNLIASLSKRHPAGSCSTPTSSPSPLYSRGDLDSKAMKLACRPCGEEFTPDALEAHFTAVHIGAVRSNFWQCG